jgi:hypothetical protein
VIAYDDGAAGAPIFENRQSRLLIRGEKKVAVQHHVNVPSSCAAALHGYTAQLFGQQHHQRERHHELMNSQTASGNGAVPKTTLRIPLKSA